MGPKFLELEKMHYEEWLQLHYRDNEMDNSKGDSEGFQHKRQASVYLEKDSPAYRAKKRRNTTNKDSGSGVKDFNGRPIKDKVSPARAGQNQKYSSPKKKGNMDFEDSYKVNKRSREVSEDEIQVIQPTDSAKRRKKAKEEAERLSPREEIQSKVEVFDKNSGEWVE